MEKIFNNIVSSFQSLWKMKNYGTTIEIITPQATMNDNFVSVFITRRGSEYIVTDGGWVEAGMYDCEPDHTNLTYQRIFNYFIGKMDIQTTEAKGQKYYYKKITEERFIPNLVFDMSQFVSSVISCMSYPLIPEKATNTFKRRVRTFLNKEFGEENMEYDRPLSPNVTVKFSAIKRENDGAKVINIVSGATSSVYANALCRSNSNFQYIKSKHEALGVKKTVTLLDDGKKGMLDNPLVKPYYELLQESVGSEVVLWSSHKQLLNIVNS